MYNSKFDLSELFSSIFLKMDNMVLSLEDYPNFIYFKSPHTFLDHITNFIKLAQSIYDSEALQKFYQLIYESKASTEGFPLRNSKTALQSTDHSLVSWILCNAINDPVLHSIQPLNLFPLLKSLYESLTSQLSGSIFQHITECNIATHLPLHRNLYHLLVPFGESVSLLFRQAAQQSSVSLDNYLLTLAIYPTRLYLAENIHSASLYPKESDALQAEFDICRNSVFLFETIHPLIGLLQMILKAFENTNSYLIFLLRILGIMNPLNTRAPDYFTFFWLLSALVMDNTALTNDEDQIIRDSLIHDLYLSERTISDLTSQLPIEMRGKTFLGQFLKEVSQSFTVGEEAMFRLQNKKMVNVISPWLPMSQSITYL
jgi:hypothetical protein